MRHHLKITVTALALLAATVTGQAAVQTSKPWLFKKLESEKQLAELSDDARIAMACSKCKSVTVITKRDLVAGRPGHGQKEITMVVHQCPGCGGEMTRKAGTKETAWAHTCSKCGDDSAFCCATESGKATSGMTK
jgi:predicted RNA-binding Zn-ribbon protein involved in translation (DUF1610 family)